MGWREREEGLEGQEKKGQRVGSIFIECNLF